MGYIDPQPEHKSSHEAKQNSEEVELAEVKVPDLSPDEKFASLPVMMRREIELSLQNVPEQFQIQMRDQLTTNFLFALSHPFDTLASACKSGSIASLRTMIEVHELDLFSLDEDDNTLIHICAWNFGHAVIRYLFDYVASTRGSPAAIAFINQVNKTQQTALHWASMSGDIDSVKCLLSFGCQLDQPVSLPICSRVLTLISAYRTRMASLLSSQRHSTVTPPSSPICTTREQVSLALIRRIETLTNGPSTRATRSWSSTCWPRSSERAPHC